MKKVAYLSSILVLLLFCSGCWDYKEYEQITQIYALGVDLYKETKQVTVTLQYIAADKSATEKLGKATTGVVYSATADTVMDALEKLQQVTANKLFYGYMQVIVVGEDAAKYIMKDIIGLMDRTPNIRNSSYIVITPGRAEGTIATFDANSLASSGRKMRMLLSSSNDSGATFPITLQQFILYMERVGVEPIAPRITSTIPKGERGEATGGTINGVRFHIQKEGNFRGGGMAVFKNEVFVGWLNERESLGLAMLKGEKVNSYKSTKMMEGLVTGDPNEKNIPLDVDSRKVLYFYLTNIKSKVKTEIDSGSPVINIDVKVHASLRKYYTDTGTEYLTPDVISSMERKLEESVSSDIMAAIKKARDEYNSDVFGFGFQLYRQHPKEWHGFYEKNWSSMFQRVPVNVRVYASISNTGTNIKRIFVK